jgi:hypothetical protein
MPNYTFTWSWDEDNEQERREALAELLSEARDAQLRAISAAHEPEPPVDEIVEPPEIERPEPAFECRPGCGMCLGYAPLVDLLRYKGYTAHVAPNMGGGIHCIRLDLDEGRHLLIDTDSFSFYEDEDDDGYGHHWFSSDDPPNDRQRAVLIDVAIITDRARRAP